MWEYLIGYADAAAGNPLGGDAPCAVEEREWPDRAAMEAALRAEGWEVCEESPHREHGRRIVFRRPVEQSASPPRHLIPCW
jgi:hypothetical protein